MRKLIFQLEKFGRNVSWKAFHEMKKIVNNDDEKDDVDKNNKYGFKSDVKPPIIKEIVPFLDEFFALAKIIEFRKCNDPFLNELKNNITKMKKPKKMIIAADKTRNLYTCDKIPMKKY